MWHNWSIKVPDFHQKIGRANYSCNPNCEEKDSTRAMKAACAFLINSPYGYAIAYYGELTQYECEFRVMAGVAYSFALIVDPSKKEVEN